jgi:hypothetical protein
MCAVWELSERLVGGGLRQVLALTFAWDLARGTARSST